MISPDNRLAARLERLERAQLVHPLDDLEPTFGFKHTLGQETAYESLLLKTRRDLHRRVAEAYEKLYAGHLDEQAAVLSHHFEQAGDRLKTFEYARRAANAAARVYAYAEASVHYTRALDAGRELNLPIADLLHARGEAYEFLGGFEKAKTDFETELSESLARQDSSAEWTALMDLGYLWASRDYAKVGELFRQALALAEKMGDSSKQAESLNRLGNWLVNVGQVREGLSAHQQALATLEGQGDEAAIAETLDLIGTANAMLGRFTEAFECLERAISIFRALDNQVALVSSLSNRITLVRSSWTDTAPSLRMAWSDYVETADEALARALRIGWQSGQAFALIAGAEVVPGFGQLGLAFDLAQQSLEVALEVGHNQWIAGARVLLGYVLFYLLDADAASEQLESGLAQSRRLGSALWIDWAAAYLIHADVVKGDLNRARGLADEFHDMTSDPRNLAERQIAYSVGYLLLAEDRSEQALDTAERLLSTAPDDRLNRPIPGLELLKGRALVRLRRYREAVEALVRALESASAEKKPLVWEIELALGEAYTRMHKREEAARELEAARKDLETLTATVTDEGIRERMWAAGLARFPARQRKRRASGKRSDKSG